MSMIGLHGSVVLAGIVAAASALSTRPAGAVEYLFTVCAGGDFGDRCSAAELQVNPNTNIGPTVSFDGLMLGDFGFGFLDRQHILVQFMSAGTLLVSRADASGAPVPLLSSSYDITRAGISYSVKPQTGHAITEAVSEIHGISASGDGIVEVDKYMIVAPDVEQRIRLTCSGETALRAPCPAGGHLGLGLQLTGPFLDGFSVGDLLMAELDLGNPIAAGAAAFMQVSQSFFAPVPEPGTLVVLGIGLGALAFGRRGSRHSSPG